MARRTIETAAAFRINALNAIADGGEHDARSAVDVYDGLGAVRLNEFDLSHYQRIRCWALLAKFI